MSELLPCVQRIGTMWSIIIYSELFRYIYGSDYAIYKDIFLIFNTVLCHIMWPRLK